MKELPTLLIDCAFAFKHKFKIMHKFRGALAYHILLKATIIFIDYIFVEALIYMLSSITKKGKIESTFAPLVVLVINNNI